VVGCVTEVLNLTITPSSTNTTTASACDSYTWAVNGTTYSASGTYSHVTGCITEVLDLTITGLTGSTIVETACSEFNWNGEQYTTSGTYIFTQDCSSDTLVLTITSLPDAQFAYSQSAYCHGDAPPNPWVATTGGQFSAFPTGLVIDQTSGAISINASDPGTYQISYSFNGACPSSSSQTITIVANADPTWTLPEPLCSIGDPIDLNALVTGTPGGSWQGDGVNNGTFDPNGFSGAIPVTYMATIGSCTAQFTQDIVVLTPPTAMAGPDVGVCGLTAAMSAINGAGSGSWTGAPDVVVGSAADPSSSVSATTYGTYTMIWTVNNGPCSASDTALVTFTDPGAGIWVDAGEDQFLEVIDHTDVHGTAAPGTTLSWWVLAGAGNVASPADSSTTITGLAIGDNLIVLTAMMNQCASISDTVLLHVDDLFIPEGYSPNGDGVNDRWEIRGIQAYPGSDLQVFNRWGKLIYESSGYHNEWDGRSMNGHDLPDDTYFYVLNLTGRRAYNGHVIIKR
nr:gliding motility-associated C-terminal domain-containing protein [Flavobacteriales bacterium]